MSNRLLDWLFPAQPAPVEAQRTVTVQEADIWSMMLPAGGDDLPSVTELENAYRDSDAVRMCVQEICQMAATAEVQASAGIKTLLEHPNQLDNWEAFITKIIINMTCPGKVFILKAPQGGRIVQELYVLKTSSVYMEPGPFGNPFKRIDYDDGLNHYSDLKVADLIFRLDPTPAQEAIWGGRGITSPVAACWGAVKLDIQRTRSMREILKRLPYMVAMAESEIETNVGQRKEFVDSVRATIGPGVIFPPKGVHMTMPNLGTDWTAQGLAMHCESRISGNLGVPAIMAGFEVGLAHSTYANYGEARLSLRQETVEPLCSTIGDLLSRGLGEEVTLTLPEEVVTQQATSADAGNGQPGNQTQPDQGTPNGDGSDTSA